MTAIVLALPSLIVLGIPVTLALDRRARGALLIGTSFLYGCGLIFFVLLGLSVVHVRWTIVTITIATLIVWVACSVGLWMSSATPRETAASDKRPVRPHWLDIFTLWTLTGYALYATLAAVWEWDFWAIWGLKARVFFEYGGIDWRFLESQWNVFAHPDYPLLLPLNYDFIALLNGAWSDRWLGALMVAFAVALLLIVRDLAAQETTTLYAAMITAAVSTIAISRYIGLAEGPMIAFGAAAVLFLRSAILFDDQPAWRHGAILLGLAANVKNEGIALAVAVAIAISILRRRDVIRLWPAVILAAPWLLLRAAHVLPTDIVGGSVIARAIARLSMTPVIAGLLIRDLVNPWFCLAVVIGIAVAPVVRRRREGFVLLVTTIQLAFYIGTYYATPHDPRWHIVTSWPRLVMQIALPVTFAVLVMLAISFPGNAEARPVE